MAVAAPAAAPSAASTVPQADIDKAMDTETTLTFWTWVPDITNEVKLFTTKYPKIKVNVVNVGQGAPHYQKLRTAIQSGQGAPDVAQVEFQFINSFTLGDGSLLDLTPYAPGGAEGQLRRTGSGPRSTPTAGCGGSRRTPARWACSIARTCSARQASSAPKTYDEFASRCGDVPLQEPEELPGERRPEPARPDRRLSVAGRRPAVRLRRQADGHGRPGQRRGARRSPSSGATW